MNEDVLNGLIQTEELKTILSLEKEAQAYLESHEWCIEVKKSWYDFEFSSYDLLGVFLFEIEPINKDVDDFIWVIAGDLPFVYLDKSIKSAHEAVDIYCKLMYDWVENVLNENSLENSFPVPIDPTFENAELLKLRIDILKEVFFSES